VREKRESNHWYEGALEGTTHSKMLARDSLDQGADGLNHEGKMEGLRRGGAFCRPSKGMHGSGHRVPAKQGLQMRLKDLGVRPCRENATAKENICGLMKEH